METIHGLKFFSVIIFFLEGKNLTFIQEYNIFIAKTLCVFTYMYIPHSDVKENAYSAGDPGLILGLERSPGEWHGNPLQHSFLENSMDRGACWAIVHGVTESQTLLATNTFTVYLGSLKRPICIKNFLKLMFNCVLCNPNTFSPFNC